MTTIPATLEETIAALVQQDVDQWGESERSASAAMHAKNCRTYGLALNTLASRAVRAGDPAAAELQKAAKRARTRSDNGKLRAAARD